MGTRLSFIYSNFRQYTNEFTVLAQYNFPTYNHSNEVQLGISKEVI
ncbi:hypothetical protein SAMN05421821_11485 [Mucilaginibacter lappiensis]|uniref:Uncharacterized protein n=1 Tax=Mucilaginibacter lappiensis TaxID=354630 RepID=A0ABR6PPW4_9SPHI|nr:hypothetical protein [Mucilaginibacter lappiensis]SIR87834.1 hypothetical protein SAMN05421821_11485 [Mucilaginibacter lappiensis]